MQPGARTGAGAGAGSAHAHLPPMHGDRLPTPGVVDAVRVVARVRPLTDGEGARAVHCADARHVSVVVNAGDRTSQRFPCSAAFDAGVDQERFFVESGVVALLHKAIQGLSTTVFAYGQTGGGKTYTVFGEHDAVSTTPPLVTTDGLLPRAATHLFDALRVLNDDREYAVTASFLEVYNEQVFDLLSHGGARAPLPVRHDVKHHKFYADGATTLRCRDAAALLRLIGKGLRVRSVASHRLNNRSSRGHCLVSIGIQSVPRAGTVVTGGDELTLFGKITFCDLAGSERLGASGSSGVTRSETGQINKSLFALGKVVSALTVNDRLAHPRLRRAQSQAAMRRKGRRGGRAKAARRPLPLPYRDSKLTMLLCDSLGGQSMALMIACCAPGATAGNESFRTLQFAMGVKRIKNTPVVLLDPQEQLVAGLRQEIKSLKHENFMLRSMNAAEPAAFGVHPPSPLMLPSDRLASIPPRAPSRRAGTATGGSRGGSRGGVGLGPTSPTKADATAMFPPPPCGVSASAALRSTQTLSMPVVAEAGSASDEDDHYTTSEYSNDSDGFDSDGDGATGELFPVIVTGSDGGEGTGAHGSSSAPAPDVDESPQHKTGLPPVTPSRSQTGASRKPPSPIQLLPASPAVSSPAFEAPATHHDAFASRLPPPPPPPPAAVAAVVDTPEALEALLRAGGTLGPPPAVPRAPVLPHGFAGGGSAQHSGSGAGAPADGGPGSGSGAATQLSKDTFLDPRKRAKALKALRRRSGDRRRRPTKGLFESHNDVRARGRQLMRSTQHFAY